MSSGCCSNFRHVAGESGRKKRFALEAVACKDERQLELVLVAEEKYCKSGTNYRGGCMSK